MNMFLHIWLILLTLNNILLVILFFNANKSILFLLSSLKAALNQITLLNNTTIRKKETDKVFTIHQRLPEKINIFDTNELMTPLRSVKDKLEIDRMKTAIEHTKAGIIAIMQQTEPGMMEYELEALLQYEIMRRGNRHMGFKSIIASGKNAATLHYGDNNCRIGKTDLI